MPLQTMLALELSAMLANIGVGDVDAVTQISDVRMKIHAACSDGAIPVQEWRVLIEESSTLLGGAQDLLWTR
jgi:hypothetical protein